MSPAQPASFRETAAWRLFQAAMFCLPWIGMGVATLVTARDWGAGLQPAWLLLAGSVALQVPQLWRFICRYRRAWGSILGPWLVAVLLSLAGLWLAPAAEPLPGALARFGKQAIQLAIMLFFMLVPAYYLVAGIQLRRIARPLVWGAVFQLAYSLLQGLSFWHTMAVVETLERVFTSNPSILSGSEQLYLGNVLQPIPRLRGTACEPLYLGNYLLLAIPLVWATAWSLRRRWIIAGLLFGLLLLTWSRGAWLAGLAGLLLFMAVGARGGLVGRGRLSRNPILWLAMAPVALALPALLLGWSEALLPFRRLWQSFSLTDWSNLTRLYSMQAAWRGFTASPLVGLGWGQFGFHFALLVDPMGLQSMFSWPVVNNFPLKVLCETGLLGLLGFLWGWWRLIAACGRRWGAAAGGDRLLLLLVVATAAVWLQLLTFSQYNLPHIWVAIGLVVGHLGRPVAGVGEV